MEETSWRQKSREIWVKEGDRNIGFFHRMVNSHKRRNTINRIRIGGEWFEGEGEVRTGIVNRHWLGAEDLKYFKPISLVGSLYKLIAKVLANRLKKVMNGLVNPT